MYIYTVIVRRSLPTLVSCPFNDCLSSPQGRFDYNDIHNNKLAGVWIKNYASPVFRKNKVHHGKDVGFFVFQDGQVRERERERMR